MGVKHMYYFRFTYFMLIQSTLNFINKSLITTVAGKKNADVPPLYGSSCQINGEHLYIMGGLKSLHEDLNRATYRIDLQTSFATKDAQWRLCDNSHSAPSLFHTSPVGTNDSKVHFYRSSENQENIKLSTFDVVKYKWTHIDVTSSRPFPSQSNGELGQESGYSLVLSDTPSFPSAQEILVFGGAKYIYSPPGGSLFINHFVSRLDLRTMSWWHSTQAGPHSIFHKAHVYDGIMYVIGGSRTVNGSTLPFNSIQTHLKIACMDIIYAYDIANDSWYTIPTTGTIPEGRDLLTSAIHKRKLYITSGFYELRAYGDRKQGLYTGNEYPSDTIHVLDMDTWQWSLITFSSSFYMQKPYPLELTCAIPYQQYLLFAGGNSQDKTGFHVFDPEKKSFLEFYRARTYYYDNITIFSILVGTLIGMVAIVALTLYTYQYYYKKRLSIIKQNREFVPQWSDDPSVSKLDNISQAYTSSFCTTRDGLPVIHECGPHCLKKRLPAATNTLVDENSIESHTISNNIIPS